MKIPEKTWHEDDLQKRTPGSKLADFITKMIGSWFFIIIHVIWFTIWIMIPVEKFPFGLLTLIVSLEAALLTTFIMMSQNRAADRDRAQARADYETDVRAKEEIEQLQNALSRIENEKLDKILALLQQEKENRK